MGAFALRNWLSGVCFRRYSENGTFFISENGTLTLWPSTGEETGKRFPGCIPWVSSTPLRWSYRRPRRAASPLLFYIASDVDWRAVILSICVGEIEYARLAWIHPQCLEPFGPERRCEAISVDLTEGRGRQKPFIQLDDDFRTGVKEVGKDLVLDARWPMHFDRWSNDCTGHCFSMCRSVLTEPSCFASIMRFASALRLRGFGRVCCHHGKHRSVAAANLLMLLFGVNVDFSLAARDRTRDCCDHRAGDDIIGMLNALRQLPEISGDVSRPLASILGLPE